MELLFRKACIEQIFPGLAGTDYELTSQIDFGYNCIAWAAGCNHRHWWPGNPKRSFWPKDIPPQETIDAFKKLFESLGYQECPDSKLEGEYEKVAIFTNGETPTHAAKQLPNGKWASKLGDIEDIEHPERGLDSKIYGQIRVFMQRKRFVRSSSQCPHS